VTLHDAFEYLARVAVFIEQARIGENLAVNENVSFENEFRKLEDDHEAGLYWYRQSQSVCLNPSPLKGRRLACTGYCVLCIGSSS